MRSQGLEPPFLFSFSLSSLILSFFLLTSLPSFLSPLFFFSLFLFPLSFLLSFYFFFSFFFLSFLLLPYPSALPSLTLGPPPSFLSNLLKQFVALLMYHRPLGVGVGPFPTFHVPVVESYFPNMAWFNTRSIIRLIKFFPQMVSRFFYFFFLSFFPNNLGLYFGVRSFEHLPFGPSPTMFVCAHPFHSSVRTTICFLPSS